MTGRAHDYLRALLLDARKSANLTQRELAARLGKPQSYVSKYEGGERRLDVLEFLDVCRALNADAASILERLEGLP